MDSPCDGIIEPKKLQTLALDSFCGLLHTALNVALETESTLDENGLEFSLRVRNLLGFDSELRLSSVVADELVSCFAAQGWLTSRILSAFCRSKIGSLSKVNVASCSIPDDEAFCLLLQHPLLELTLSVSEGCDTLVWWEDLEQFTGSPAATSMISLTLCGIEEDIFGDYDDEVVDDSFVWLKSLTSLNRLQLQSILPLSSRAEEALCRVVEKLPNLTVLNLTGTCISDFSATNSNVKALTLSDMPVHKPAFFNHVLAMESLVSLDLSSELEMKTQDTGSVPQLTQMLSRLPNLRYLDLSGHTIRPSDLDCFDPPHPGMKFLGLLATNACRRSKFNCDTVSGVADERQLLVSLRTYAHRILFMEYALRQLLVFVKGGHLNALQEKLVQALLPLFERNHLPDVVVILTSACLWYLTSDENLEQLSTLTRKRTIVTLVKFMEKDYFFHDLSMGATTNCVLCLERFSFPEEMEFIFTCILRLLIKLTQMHHIESVESNALYLLRKAQQSLNRKVLVKNLGGIKAALQCIESKIVSHKCDDALEAAWDLLFSITDETPENSVEVIECGGIQMFTECFKMFRTMVSQGQEYEAFEDEIESMLGALGNVAEVEHLRGCLVQPEVLDILQCVCANITTMEAQHNTSKLIAHVATVEESLWEGVSPSKDNLLCNLETVADTWSFRKKMRLVYRSLIPIIEVVQFPDERVALWGVWALANLCHTRPDRYCPMLRKEGGVEVVQNLLSRAETDRVKKLASQVLELVSADVNHQED